MLPTVGSRLKPISKTINYLEKSDPLEALKSAELHENCQSSLIEFVYEG
jgi:hypothetical protein